MANGRVPAYKRNPIEDVFQNLGLINYNYDTAQQQAQQSQQALMEEIQKRAATDTSFATMMQQKGYMKPDGTVNRDFFMDKQLVDDVKNQLAENNQQSIQAAREAGNRAQMRGIGGGNQNMAGTINQNARQNTREAMNTVRSERNRAGEEAKWFGGKAQQDLKDDLNKKVDAAGSVYQLDTDYANQQERMALQSPEGVAGLVGDALGIVTGLGSLGSMVKDGLGIAKQVTGGGNKPVGSAGASNPYRSPAPGYTKQEANGIANIDRYDGSKGQKWMGNPDLLPTQSEWKSLKSRFPANYKEGTYAEFLQSNRQSMNNPNEADNYNDSSPTQYRKWVDQIGNPEISTKKGRVIGKNPFRQPASV